MFLKVINHHSQGRYDNSCHGGLFPAASPSRSVYDHAILSDVYTPSLSIPPVQSVCTDQRRTGHHIVQYQRVASPSWPVPSIHAGVLCGDEDRNLYESSWFSVAPKHVTGCVSPSTGTTTSAFHYESEKGTSGQAYDWPGHLKSTQYQPPMITGPPTDVDRFDSSFGFDIQRRGPPYLVNKIAPSGRNSSWPSVDQSEPCESAQDGRRELQHSQSTSLTSAHCSSDMSGGLPSYPMGCSRNIYAGHRSEFPLELPAQHSLRTYQVRSDTLQQISQGHSPRQTSHVCRWRMADGSVCGQYITRRNVPKHLAGHGIIKMARHHPTRCRWRDCKSRNEVMTRGSIARHVREVHLGYSRRGLRPV